MKMNNYIEFHFNCLIGLEMTFDVLLTCVVVGTKISLDFYFQRK